MLRLRVILVEYVTRVVCTSACSWLGHIPINTPTTGVLYTLSLSSTVGVVSLATTYVSTDIASAWLTASQEGNSSQEVYFCLPTHSCTHTGAVCVYLGPLYYSVQIMSNRP